MRHFITAVLAIAAFSVPAWAQCGSWKAIDNTFTWTVNTHGTDGVATDADSVPTYRVYEDETATPILTGSMAAFDSGNTTGYYSEQLTLSAANGFEEDKSYNIYVTATVGGDSGTMTCPVHIPSLADSPTNFSSLSINGSGDVGVDLDNTSGTLDPTETTLRYLPNNTAATGIELIPFDTDGNITKGASGLACELSLDGAAFGSLDTPNYTEIEATTGAYWTFDLIQSETNGSRAVVICTGTGMVETVIAIEFQQ